MGRIRNRREVEGRMPSVIKAILLDMSKQDGILNQPIKQKPDHGLFYTESFSKNVRYTPNLPAANLTLDEELFCTIHFENKQEGAITYGLLLSYLISHLFERHLARGEVNCVVGSNGKGHYQIEVEQETGGKGLGYFHFYTRVFLDGDDLRLSNISMVYIVETNNKTIHPVIVEELGPGVGAFPFYLRISVKGDSKFSPDLAERSDKPRRETFEPINLFPEEEVSPPADNVSWEAFLERRGMSLENLPRDIFSTGDIKAKKLLEMGKKENVTVADLENPDDELKRKIMAILGKLPEEK